MSGVARPFPKHPWAMMPGPSGAFQLSSGDRFIHDIDGRTGWADEFTSDGDAYVCWDDGTYGLIKWNHMSPEPKSALQNPRTEQDQAVADAYSQDGAVREREGGK